MPSAVIYICAAMLFVGAAPLPYGYYMLLRLVACGVFAFAAFVAFDRKCKALPWIYSSMALIFNPIVKIHFPKEMWAVVDVASGVLLLATAKAVKTNV
ncbi:MAG: DUF6804 family protein [Burkholderiales bacterium]